MTTTSSTAIMPRSPCAASAGWTKNAGVPVEASVDASLRATWPDLPMPETTTRPPQRSISSTAATKGPPSRPASEEMARASVSSTSRASASARFASTEGEGAPRVSIWSPESAIMRQSITPGSRGAGDRLPPC